MKASRPHDETVVTLLKSDPDFAAVYLGAALDESDQPGGQYALLTALCHIAEAQGNVHDDALPFPSKGES